MKPPIQHDRANGRFTTEVDGHTASADYRLTGDVMQMTHTHVPSPIAGRGIAAALVRSAFEHAQAEGLRVEPLCSYVRSYVARHPEVQPLLA